MRFACRLARLTEIARLLAMEPRILSGRLIFRTCADALLRRSRFSNPFMIEKTTSSVMGFMFGISPVSIHRLSGKWGDIQAKIVRNVAN